MLLAFEQTEQSMIFDNKQFGYWKITVERPLRLSVDLPKKRLEEFAKICIEQNDSNVMDVISQLAEKMEFRRVNNFNEFLVELNIVADKLSVKLPVKRLNLIKNNLAIVDENAEKVIKKIFKTGKVEANALYGLFSIVIDGKACVVEYESDANVRDTEQIPLLHVGGIEQFFEDEVLSFAPDAWVDESKTQIGYEINFSKYFDKPVQLRTLDEIKAEIYELEIETEGLLERAIGRKELC
ncbi:hypothetical protein [Paenibacillus sp. SI8]|uniref:hypothetical protein n=1 Tax=unclassified Paenibacillus TaxID=185978 RepID=UPI003466E21A